MVHRVSARLNTSPDALSETSENVFFRCGSRDAAGKRARMVGQLIVAEFLGVGVVFTTV